MARSRAFDSATVLTSAMLAFRQHGFAGLSIKQLEQATGVSAGSLYNAYGDKSGLFRAAFEHYFAKIIEPRLAAAATVDDLERVFLGLFEMPMADGYGCLVTNAAIEFGAVSSPASGFIARGFDVLESVLRRVLERAIGAPAAETAALRLVLIHQGILVLSRAGRCTDDYLGVVRAEFDDLRRAATRTRHRREKISC